MFTSLSELGQYQELPSQNQYEKDIQRDSLEDNDRSNSDTSWRIVNDSSPSIEANDLTI